jgi:hypothetical protein
MDGCLMDSYSAASRERNRRLTFGTRRKASVVEFIVPAKDAETHEREETLHGELMMLFETSEATRACAISIESLRYLVGGG